MIAGLKTNILLASQQQISIIMSINGVLQNAKWPDFVLTETKSSATVDGQSFVKTDNQRVSRQLEVHFQPWS
jgi:hypothetical protein